MENKELKFEEIKAQLRAGVKKFEYKKVDGTTRTATGTTHQDVLTEHSATPSGTYNEKFGVIAYFDMDAKGWRCFKTENFIQFLD